VKPDERHCPKRDDAKVSNLIGVDDFAPHELGALKR
jgi:hypothetical protein